MDTVCFGLAEDYDKGRQSGVTMSGDEVIEVHKSEDHDELWYRRGKAALGIVLWHGSHKYDTGITPAVAFAGDRIVEVHRSEKRPRLFYKVGRLNGEEGAIDWSPSHDYDDGEHPRVALNASGVVVEMHATYNDTKSIITGRKYDLWYRVGRIDDGDLVNWGKGHKHSTGVNPSVALFDDGRVIEMHKSEHRDEVFISHGVVTGETIKWNEPAAYMSGRMPVIACDRGGSRLVEVHEHLGGIVGETIKIIPEADVLAKTANLVSATGVLAGAELAWGDPHGFDTGWNPAVALWDRTAVQTHSSNDKKKLWSSMSLVADRRQWMRDLREVLNPRPLWEITLPATHDSGAFRLESEPWSKPVPEGCRAEKFPVPPGLVEPYAIAQSRDIGGQLSHGVRYFDLRLIPAGNDFHAYHDLIGPPVSKMLEQLAEFLGSVERELVILKFSHFCDFNDDHHKDLIEKIQTAVGSFLFTQSVATAEEMFKKTFAELTSDKPLVMIDYRADYVNQNPTAGFWRDLFTYDESSKKDDYEKMAKDQGTKLLENPGTPNKLHLLSWTLTPTDAKSFEDYSSLHEMSKTANRHLGKFCNEWAPKRQINFLYVDFFEEARAVDIAIQMNA